MRLFLLCLLLCGSSLAFDVPPFTPNVVDTSGALTNDAIANLNQRITDLQQSTTVRPAVLVVNTLYDDSIEDAAEKTFKLWALGEKGKDNGLLIIVAIQDRKMRLEVGYGLEGDLTDYFCSQVINDTMKPHFRAGHFEAGISAALGEVQSKMQGQSQIPSSEPELSDSPAFRQGVRHAQLWALLFVGVPAFLQICALIVALIVRPVAFEKAKKAKKFSWLPFLFGVSSGRTLGVKLFFLINPGVFIVVFPLAFGEREVALAFYAVGVICVALAWFVSWQNIRTLFSLKHYLRSEARRRLNVHRASKTPGSTYTMFGRTYTAPSASSSSSSSGGFSSSSSGGGSSGGGGASGSW
jgi:uncharacterized protein